jgi:hypothetical protein
MLWWHGLSPRDVALKRICLALTCCCFRLLFGTFLNCWFPSRFEFLCCNASWSVGVRPVALCESFTGNSITSFFCAFTSSLKYERISKKNARSLPPSGIGVFRKSSYVSAASQKLEERGDRNINERSRRKKEMTGGRGRDALLTGLGPIDGELRRVDELIPLQHEHREELDATRAFGTGSSSHL